MLRTPLRFAADHHLMWLRAKRSRRPVFASHLAIAVLSQEGLVRRDLQTFLSRSGKNMPLHSPMLFRWRKAGRNIGHADMRKQLTTISSIRLHWPEYLMEIGEITIYMFFACGFATLLQHPASPVRQFIVSSLSRCISMGFAIAATVIAIRVRAAPRPSQDNKKWKLRHEIANARFFARHLSFCRQELQGGHHGCPGNSTWLPREAGE